MRLVLAAGGTGGHIYPALAVIEALRNPPWTGSAILAFGRHEGMEATLFGKRDDVEYVALCVHPFLKRRILLWPFYLVANFFSVLSAFFALRRWKPEVVLGMGGYVSFPVIMAALLARMPVAIADQNALPGRANRLLARWVDSVFYAYDESLKYFPENKCKKTGIPLRREILERRSERPFQSFGLRPDLFTILVFGGSQGAQALCQAVVDMLPSLDLAKVSYQILLQTGKRNMAWCRERKFPPSVSLIETIDDMAGAYASADLVVCRAGAVSLAELAVQGKPAILVPYPYAKDDHQTLNAASWEEVGAARVLAQSSITGEVLAREILDLASNPEGLSRMAEAARSLAIPDATEQMLNALQELTKAK